jgi:O-antigen/teichoic acid export membrane protein
MSITYPGTILVMVIAFVWKALAARQMSREEFGLFSSALSILSLAVGVSELGLPEAIVRFAGLYRGQDQPRKVSSVIHTSYALSLSISFLITATLLMLSKQVGQAFLGMQNAAGKLWVLWGVIPMAVTVDILAAAFVGHERVEIKILFVDVLQNGFNLFTLFFFFGSITSASALLQVYALSVIVSGLVLIAYSLRNRPWREPADGWLSSQLLGYSLPLLAGGLVGLVVTTGRLLILGHFRGQAEVALFSTSFLLALLVLLVLTALDPIFVPKVAELYGRGKGEDIQRVYRTLTRWMILGGMPIGFLLLFAAEAVLSMIYGLKYVEGAWALRIMVVCMFVQVSSGPNDAMLKVLGRTDLVVRYRVLGDILNLVLGLALVWRWGAAGMALAVGIAIVVRNALYSWDLYRLSGIHPLDRRFVATVLSCGMAWGLSSLVFGATVRSIIWLAAAETAFLFLLALFLTLTRAFGEDEFAIIHAVRSRIGVKFG